MLDRVEVTAAHARGERLHQEVCVAHGRLGDVLQLEPAPPHGDGAHHRTPLQRTGISARPSMRLELTRGERRRIGGDLEPLEPGEDGLEHQLRLEAREVRAQAEVRSTGPERDVVVRVPGDVDVVGTLERALVAVRGGVHHQHVVALGDGLAADLGVLGGDPRERHHRGRVTQQLFDRDREQLGVVAQPGEVVGTLEQAEGTGRDEVARRLRARVLQQHEEHRQLHLREVLAVDLGVRAARS